MDNGENLGFRRGPDGAGKTVQGVKLCRDNVKKKATRIRQEKWLKSTQSPSSGASHNHRKAFLTPKRSSRLRCSGSSHGESPDTVQDIIWEPASPPAGWNGKGSEKSPETKILDIVNRIAPKEGGHGGQDPHLLQWIGDGTIRCTPEVPAPRPRRTSIRQNSVEDLKKLAREFDLRINKEQQESGHDGHPAAPGQPEERQAADLDAELNALFDAPTQRLSHQLSQNSSISSQESKTNLTSGVDRGGSVPKKGSGASSAVADKAAESSKSVSGKGDFDDDWENDDLLNDSFVLEMTQNPTILDGNFTAAPAAVPSPRLPVSKAGDPVIKVSPSVSARVAACGQAGPGGGGGGGSGGATGLLMGLRSKGLPIKPSAFMQEPSGHSQGKNTTSGEPRKACFKAADAGRHEHSRARTSVRQQEAQTAAPANISKQTRGSHSPKRETRQVPDEGLKPQAASEDVWGDGGDEDDDLLYRVCDVVERLSSSQEEARASAEPADVRPAPCATRQLSPSPSDSVQAHTVVTGSWPPAQTSASHFRPTHGFTRSLSVPDNRTSTTTGSTKMQSFSFPGGRAVHGRTIPSGSLGPNQCQFTQLRSPPVQAQDQRGPSHPPGSRHPNSACAHQPTFKRHLHEPRPLPNKVFVSNQRPAKCSAAEIERKKQEAIARRKLRMEASQKPTTPT